MSITTLINRPCTVVSRAASATLDSYGNAVDTETSVATVCELQQRARDEADQSGEHSDTDWTAFFLATEDLSTADALIVDGQQFEFVGDPWTVRNPRTGDDSHIEASVRRAGGGA